MSNPMDEDHLDAAKKYRKNSGEMMSDYKDWKKSIRENTDFDDKTRELIALAAATAANSQHSVHTHGQKALKHGASEKQVADVIQIASQVQAGSTMSYGLQALEHTED